MDAPESSPHTRPQTPAAVLSATTADLVARARAMLAPGQRRMLGITGTPGAGKSTLCAALAGGAGREVAVVGMDGFHLANQELVRLGRRERKGAPDTFDADGYAALLERLQAHAQNRLRAHLRPRPRRIHRQRRAGVGGHPADHHRGQLSAARMTGPGAGVRPTSTPCGFSRRRMTCAWPA